MGFKDGLCLQLVNVAQGFRQLNSFESPKSQNHVVDMAVVFGVERAASGSAPYEPASASASVPDFVNAPELS